MQRFILLVVWIKLASGLTEGLMELELDNGAYKVPKKSSFGRLLKFKEKDPKKWKN